MRLALSFALVAAAAACNAPPPQDYRGAGLPVDSMSQNDRVSLYQAVLGASFPLENPNLWLMADPLLLPRKEGLAGGDPVPIEIMGALKRQGFIRGNCQLPLRDTRVPLICRTDRAGYLVRFSEPFRMAPDTVQVHLAVQEFAIPDGPLAEKLRYEKAYQMARSATGWSAVREARLPLP